MTQNVNDENSSPVSEKQNEPVIRDPAKVLSALEAVRRENDEYKKQLSQLKKQQVDTEEYNRLKQFEASIKERKDKAEEERLRHEQNWDELTKKKLNDQESKFLTQIKTLNSNLSSVSNELKAATEIKESLRKNIDEIKLRQAAFDQYILNGGKRDYFQNVWKGELRDRVGFDENGKILIYADSKKSDVVRNETGEPSDMNSWMQLYRSSGGGIFFEPVVNSAGSGVSPTNNNSTSAYKGKSRVIYISKKDAASQKFMTDLKNKLGNDPLQAIAEGRVVIR